MEDKGNTGSTAVETVENTVPVKKTAPKGKSTKTQRPKSSHPPTSEMVNAAIRELKDRKGSSLQAIKKYVASTYKVDGEKLAPFIKRYLKSAVTSGAVVQTKGKGASGSFKLSVAAKGSESKAKVQRTVKAIEPRKVKKSVEKKTTPVRKPAAKKSNPTKKSESAKKAAKKSPKAAEKPKPLSEAKTMSKSRKAKAPAAKTKTPKPKKVASKAVKTAKK